MENINKSQMETICQNSKVVEKEAQEMVKNALSEMGFHPDGYGNEKSIVNDEKLTDNNFSEKAGAKLVQHTLEKIGRQ